MTATIQGMLRRGVNEIANDITLIWLQINKKNSNQFKKWNEQSKHWGYIEKKKKWNEMLNYKNHIYTTQYNGWQRP